MKRYLPSICIPSITKPVTIAADSISEDYSSRMRNKLGATLSKLPGPVMVTGHTGFKGSWLTMLLEKLEISTVGYSLEPEKNSLFERSGIRGHIPEMFADVRDQSSLERFVLMQKPSCIIHMAAQPLVLESYKNPRQTFDVNVMGTVNLLEISRKYDFIQSVVVVTTDKVYRNNNSGQRFVETDPLGGKDPYSASKVAAESAVTSWQQISRVHGGPRVLAVRAGNVIGGGDLAENRLIPDLVRSILINKEDVVIRNPDSTRPWQHALDPLRGYLLALEASLIGRTEDSYNFAPDGDSISVKEVAEKFISLAGSKLNLRVVHAEKNLEASILNLDATRAKKELQWENFWTQSEAINQSIAWWLNTINSQASPLEACNEEIEMLLKNSNLKEEHMQ